MVELRWHEVISEEYDEGRWPKFVTTKTLQYRVKGPKIVGKVVVEGWYEWEDVPTETTKR